MRPRALQTGALAALALSVAACASAPEHLYTLESAARAPAAGGSDRPLVLVGPLTVPEIVDRPQLIVREGKYAIAVNEQERWATPLKDSLPQVIARQLGELCPTARFGLVSDPATDEHPAHLVIDFTNMDIDRTTGVTVIANWTFRDDSANGIARVSQGHARIEAAEYSGYVDSMRRAIDAWTNEVAAQLPPCR
jgi:uncharacterized lipoprotein YmbA